MIQDDDPCIQTLMKLGLTLLQAKAYLALAQLGKAEVKTISKTSNVARPDIYRVMPTLEKIGLAEKIIANPTMYKATPLKEGCYILLQNKTQEHTELQQQTLDLIKNFHENNDKTNLQEETQQFIICSSETLLLKWLYGRPNTAQISIDYMGKWESTKVNLFNSLQNLKRAMKRGVKIRVITEKHEDDKSLQKIIQTLKKNPLFEIRYLSQPVPVETALYDGMDVGLCIAIPMGKSVPSLMSNHPQFLKVMTTYFEEIWNTAQDSTDLARKNADINQ